MEQLQAADKVVIARWWFAQVAGATVAGAMTMGGKIMLDTADTLERYEAHIRDGIAQAEGAQQRFLEASRRAQLMLEAVAHDPDMLQQAGLNPSAFAAAQVFGEALGRLGGLER